MESFFLGCFFFGAFFTLISAVLGGLGDVTHGAHGGHLGDAGHTGHTGELTHHGEVGHWLASFFSVSAAVAFLTWFGAVGYVLMKYVALGLLLALPLAVVAGVGGGGVIVSFLRWVRRGDRPMRAEDYTLQGTVARVSVSIPANGVGEIVFSLAGTRRNEAARALQGQAIAGGEEVVVTHYERGVAIVQPVRGLLEDDSERLRLHQASRENESHAQD
jgi:hypothetical protein